VTDGARVEPLLRELAPRVLGALVRRYGSFGACEDAVQEALLAAARQWPREGVPEHPQGWLVAVASRRLVDEVRSDRARRRREDAAAAVLAGDERSLPQEPTRPREHDDTLTLLLLCCHPALTPASQIALTLRAVGGLTTAEIAHAFLVPEATMAQRISRAKATIRDRGFATPPPEELPARMRVAQHALYLIFNEGYTASAGTELQRTELADEAIRLTRLLRRLAPGDDEVAGLLALMLLTDARRAARTGPGGALVPLVEQDRSLWDGDAIAEGVALVSEVLTRGALGPFQLQAAIAAVHAEAATAADTDWPQILGLYGLLERIAPNPTVALNRAVAVGMAVGPAAGLEALEAVKGMDGHHRLEAVRAHLLEMAGETAGARDAYREAARRTTSLPERRYLEGRAARLGLA
jgi:RNA polymerase sigma factor (sigma-70 family)